jgi:hypothetical protein
MSNIKDLINSLRAMELPKGAESLLSSIATEAQTLETDRDDLKGKVQKRQEENDKLKTRAQTAESERDDLKAKLPAEGTVALPKDDAELLSAYKELGSVDDIKGAQTKATTLERQTLVSKIARANGWDEDVLGEQLVGKELKVEGEGDAATYSLELGEGKTKAVDVYIKEDRAKYLPALQVTQERRQVYTGSAGDKGGKQDPVKNTLDTIYGR